MKGLPSVKKGMYLLVFIVLATIWRRGEAVGGEECDNSNAPNFLSLECALLADGDTSSSCRSDVNNGVDLNQCDSSRPCSAYAGLGLNVTCRVPVPGHGGVSVVSGDMEVYRDGESLGNDTWRPFTTSEAEGRYECRWRENGSLYANRWLEVDDRVYIIPHDAMRQFCSHLTIQLTDRVLEGYNCSTADSTSFFDLDRHHTLRLRFYVVGLRPISLSVDMVWAKHYPVTLDLSLSSQMASTDNLLHSVEFRPDNLVFVNQKSVTCYLEITGTTANRSSSMCVQISFQGKAVLFPNTSLPGDVTVAEGQSAAFRCDVKTTQDSGLAFTVAILIKPPSSNFTECFNYSFSPSHIFNENTLKRDSSCAGLVVSNSSVGQNLDKTHHLTATWPRPSLSLSGAEVLCAIATRGITQWARTGTLTVLPSSPSFTPSLSTPLHPSSRRPELRALGAISLLLLAALCFLGVLLVWRYRRTSSPNKPPHRLDEIPLAQTSLPSSVANTPTMTTSQPLLPMISLPPSLSPHLILNQLQQSTDSMDSGLDLAENGDGNKVVLGGSHLLVTTGNRSNSMGDLFFPPSRDVCLYVSYCDSQSDWVRESLLPLLHSFQPITVTDHEGHMIAGSVISEERLRLLQSADKVVAVISPDYQLSEWCCYELQHVIQQSPRGAGHLIPILCAGCRELPSTIATLHPISLKDPHWQHKLRIAIRRQHHHSN